MLIYICEEAAFNLFIAAADLAFSKQGALALALGEF
jgi:hypothetical protein